MASGEASQRSLKKPLVIIALIVVAVIVVAAAYQLVQASMQMPAAENLKIEGIKVNRKADTMTGIVVKNVGSKPESIVKVTVIRVQSRLAIFTKDLPTPVVVNPGETGIVRVSCELDHYYRKEGCDYKVLLVTSEGKAADYVFGYPMTVEELGYARE
ncbi:MAG: hypothetical protein ACXQTQ_00350 [Candidatus Hecatellaceae archaeon]